MREGGRRRSAKVAAGRRLRLAFAAASAIALLAAAQASASEHSGSAAAARSYGPADRAAVDGSAPGHATVTARLPSFAAAAKISRRERGTVRPSPIRLTHRGERSKIRAEEDLNRSGKRAVKPPTPVESAPADPASSFPGIGFNQSLFIPPDVEIAAGPHHIVEAVNGRITVFNKGGTQAESATPPAFFDALGVIADDNIFDPQVEYNEYVNRFFVLYSTRNDAASRSFQLIAVSNTDDPTQGWKLYGLDAGLNGSTNTNNWCDYPHLGYSVQGTIITCNQFTHSAPATFQYAKIRVLDTSQLTSGSCCSWWDFWDLREGPTLAQKVFTIQPTAMHNAIGSDGAFLAAAQGGGGAGSNLHVYRVPNVLECCDGDAVGPGLDEAQRSVGSYSSPPDAEQPGGVQAIDTGDARLLYAVFHWPRMYVGQNVASGSDSTVSFTEFAINQYPNNLTVANDWRIAPGGMNRYYPGTDSRPGSDKSEVYTASNASTNAGSRWIEIPAATTCTTCFNGEFIQRSGAGTYLQLDTIGRNRWGDYMDASRDPNGTGIWIGGEFVSSQDTWGTELGLTYQAIDSTAPTTTASLSPSPNANGWINANGTVSLNATDSGPPGNVTGVRSITYSASGANPISQTTVNANSASIPITADGVTTVSYTATDNWGNTESTGSMTVRKDATAPTINPGPTQSFKKGTAAKKHKIPVRIDWAATDATSGICSYGPLSRRDAPAGSFAVQPGLPATPLMTKARQQLKPGFHRYRIEASDCADNTAALNGPAQRLRVKQEKSKAIEFSNGWKQVDDRAAFKHELKRTREKNRRAKLTFEGTSVAWGAKRNSGSGKAKYKFDGSTTTVNLHSADTRNRRLVAVTNSTAGSHKVAIKNKATRGHPKITVDFIAWLK
jgi:hypothetical protein